MNQPGAPSRTSPAASNAGSADAPIGPVDLAAERAALGGAVEAALQRVLASGQYVLGPEVETFERAFASYQGVEHGIGLASGTDALALPLLALGLQPGDHVLTTPFTFFASAGAIAWIGAVPRFADVDPETALLTPESARAALDAHTRCILPVHLYGQLCDMRGFRSLADERGLLLLEDAAQAHGSRRDGLSAGQAGDAAGFSFYPTKNLGCPGDGGLVLTRRAEVASALRRMRDHGSAQKYVHEEFGTNSRLAAMHAAVLNVKLPLLERWNERRRAIAALYDAAFARSEAIRPLTRAPGALHAYHQYTVRVKSRAGRDELAAKLRERKIATGVHYPAPVHLQKAAAGLGYRAGDFPAAEALAREVLCLPVHPFLTDAQVERVAAAVLACC